VQTIKQAGLQQIKVVDETPFAVELMLNDAEAQSLIRKTKMTPEKLKEIGTRVVSIKVEGKKPKK
jgi:PP-loop superfamily ATP-utilizing enzyme